MRVRVRVCVRVRVRVRVCVRVCACVRAGMRVNHENKPTATHTLATLISPTAHRIVFS